MTLTVDISPEVEAEIARQAASRGRQVDAYVASLLEDAVHFPAEELTNTGLADAVGLGPRVFALDWSRCPAVESIPGKLGGAWVFKDTRMPVAAIFENLEDGVAIDELVELYAGLTREQITAVLDFAARSLDAPPHGD